MRLSSQVLALRIISVLIASSVVFLGYMIGRLVTRSEMLALLAAVLLACLPGLYIDVCRVGNDSLAIALTAAVLLLAVTLCQGDSRAHKWLIFGALMGADLLTKAYALALLPLIGVVVLSRRFLFPGNWKRDLIYGGVAYAVVAAVAGWWYARQWITTGSLSGEQTDVAAASMSLAQKIARIGAVNWSVVLDTCAFSHIWVGGWSFLVVRSWMYRVFEVVALLAALGLLVYAARIARAAGRSSILRAQAARTVMLGTVLIAAGCAVAYHSLVTALVQNINSANGWYLDFGLAAEVVLLAVGFIALFGRRWSPAAVAAVSIFAIALDVYTVHFLLMPYYTGLIAHRASGSLPAFHFETLVSETGLLVQRLAVNEAIGRGAAAILWAAYLTATLGLGVLSVFIPYARRRATIRTWGMARATRDNGGATP
jgi:hypothetical protein